MDEFLVDPKTLIKKSSIQPDDYLQVDLEKCIGCKKCSIICPMDLYEIIDGKARLDSDYQKWCLECAHCSVICPVGAIQFQYPKGGSGIIYEKG
ncbi:MAG: 4Fe-4S dicluster domain-containing protein [Candidatus Helarchaeales archaeon]